ncbi:hypothetical protein Lokhon_01948 [Limimaricola hongkongensis DSM 17492]|uniref:Uncharacterized protein n=1 Tax=Limimaricola hongkongensis DSM 17492 TaxID=1122180 RepID=A0A017HBJ4_9RHOB|nr:hypothetical protein Lokhon_01948 [Limimaricola hongkongensis DSM 17492]
MLATKTLASWQNARRFMRLSVSGFGPFGVQVAAGRAPWLPRSR